MGCGGSKTSPEKEDEGMSDIEVERSCTDCIWLPLFGLFWFGMIVVAVIGVTMGHPTKLIYATDNQGKVCGEGVNANNYRAVYPRLTEDMFEMAQQAASEGSEVDASSINFYGICVEKCPMTGDFVCDQEGDEAIAKDTKVSREVQLETCIDKTFAKGGAFLSKDPGLYTSASCQHLLEHCWKIDSDTRSIFYRCLPLYNITKSTSSGCIYPSSELSVDDDRCSKARLITTTISEQPAKKNALYEQLNSVFATVMRYFGDVQKAAHVIMLSGGLGALVVGLVWLIALRYAAGCMVWSSVAFVIVLCIVMTVFSFSKAGFIGVSDLQAMTGSTAEEMEASSAYLAADDEYLQAWKWVAYGSALMTVVLLVVIAAMKSKIKIAIGIVKETSKAVHDMKSLMVYPLVTTTLLICLMLWWLIVAAYIISADGLTLNNIKSSGALNYNSPFGKTTTGETPTPVCTVQEGCVYNATTNITFGISLQYYNSTHDDYCCGVAMAPAPAPAPFVNNTNSTGGAFGVDGNANFMRYIMIYHFFGLLWTNQFIQGVAIMVISGSFSKWYFAGPHDADEDERPDDYDERMTTPVLKSCCRTVRYHLGTAMFGSFIIACVQFARAALEYVSQQTKAWQDGNKFVKCAFKMVGCCLYCFEKCVKYVSKMAYITTAISGTGFCVSAYRSIQLFRRESALISIVYMISNMILVLSKGIICLTSGVMCYVWLTYGYAKGEGVSNIAFPLVLSMMFGYFVAEAVLDVYTTGIDTILLCYSLDKENNAESGNIKAGTSLQEFINHNKKKKVNDDGEEEEEEDEMSDAKFAAVAPSGNDGGGSVVSI